MTTRISSPPPKRVKLDPDLEDSDTVSAGRPDTKDDDEEGEAEADGEHCSICLQSIADRTVIPKCSHEFCFECLLVWTGQSRRCPLCSQNVGEYLIHHIRSKYDFQKHYLTPLRTSPQPQVLALPPRGNASTTRRPRREVQWGRNTRRVQEREAAAIDELERAIDKRRWVYRNGLYAKHVASNSFTRYRPFPTPAQFAANPDLVTRATIFIRRELRVWGGLDVEFLTTFTISLMKSLDIRSESAVKLLAEFLDLDAEHDFQVKERSNNPRANAEHFAHELYSYLRSPYRDLFTYDKVVQYDIPEDSPPPRWQERTRRWRSPSHSRSPPRRLHSSSRSRSRSRSQDRSRRVLQEGSSSQSISASRARSQSVEESITSTRMSAPSSLTRRPPDAAAAHPKGRQDDVENGIHSDSRDNERMVRLKDVKGKGKAVGGDEQSARLAAPQNLTRLNVDEPVTTDTGSSFIPPTADRPISPNDSELPPTPISDAIQPAERRRPRIRRDAWTSVQAHLAKPSATSRQDIARPMEIAANPRGEISVKGAARALKHRQSDSPEEDYDSASFAADNRILDVGPPSLLQRLSNPEPNISSESYCVRADDHRYRPNTTHGAKDARPGLSSASATELSSDAHSEGQALDFSGASKDDVRAAMGTARDALPDSRRIIDDVSAGPGSASLKAEASSSQLSLSNGTKLSTSDLRARLFSKLEDEKRLQHQATEGISGASIRDPGPNGQENSLDALSAEDEMSASTRGSHAADRNGVDAEESLRRQIRLRARLAAEKRNAAGYVDESLQSSDSSSTAESSREALLRAQLRRLRG